MEDDYHVIHFQNFSVRFEHEKFVKTNVILIVNFEKK